VGKQQSRPARWSEAVGDAKTALEALQEAASDLDADRLDTATSDFESAMQALADVRQEYQEWYDNMSENLQAGATGEKLEAVLEIDVENVSVDADEIRQAIQNAVEDVIADAIDVLDEAENAELPIGFGRD